MALVLSGCASTGSDSGRYEYLGGRLKDTLAAPVPQAEAASRAAFEELDLVGVDGFMDKLKAKVSARMADGTKVQITLKAIDFESSAISIKVGTIGDRSISLQILRYIQRELEE